jgi:hypothetical protein
MVTYLYLASLDLTTRLEFPSIHVAPQNWHKNIKSGGNNVIKMYIYDGFGPNRVLELNQWLWTAILVLL